MNFDMPTLMREHAEMMRGLDPAYAAIAAAMTPAWSAVEAGLRGLLGRDAVVHRADGMILVQGVTGYPFVAFIQVLRDHLDVTIESSGRRSSFRTPLSAQRPPGRIAAERVVVDRIRLAKLWTAVTCLD